MLAIVTTDIIDDYGGAIRFVPVGIAIPTRAIENGFHGNDSGDTARTVILELTMIITCNSEAMLPQ